MKQAVKRFNGSVCLLLFIAINSFTMRANKKEQGCFCSNWRAQARLRNKTRCIGNWSIKSQHMMWLIHIVRIRLWPVSQSNPTPSKPQLEREAFIKVKRCVFMAKEYQIKVLKCTMMCFWNPRNHIWGIKTVSLSLFQSCCCPHSRTVRKTWTLQSWGHLASKWFCAGLCWIHDIYLLLYH